MPPRRPLYAHGAIDLPSAPPDFNAACVDFVPDFFKDRIQRACAEVEPGTPACEYTTGTMDEEGHVGVIGDDVEIAKYQFMAGSDDVFGI